MKSIALICSLLFFSFNSHAQWKFEYAPIDQLSTQVTEPNNPFQIQMYATTLAINQQYLLSTFQWDKLTRSRNYNTDSLYKLYQSYIELPAPATIIRLAGEQDVLLLDELHHLPQHRVFLHSILNELYKKGYRYLALEALYEDVMATKKVSIESGVYIKEPNFANMIKAAMKMGFTVFGYEGTDFSNNSKRDSIAASNILKKWNKDNGKLIVYGGPAHIAKVETSWGKSVGYWLTQAGYKTFSVSQTGLYYSDQKDYVHPFYTFNKNKYPIVLSIADNQYFSTKKEVDMVIIHPVTKMIGGLPNWLLNLHSSITPQSINAIFNPTVASYCKIYAAEEAVDMAVPIGIFQLSPGMQQQILLQDGEYVAVIEQSPLPQKSIRFTVKSGVIVQ